ncbi:GNAT family N-acetyltransferase [Eubacteriales bacterium mix99]
MENLGKMKFYRKHSLHVKDVQNIRELKKICTQKENLFLKLELDLKMNFPRAKGRKYEKSFNEFFCRKGGMLVGYLGIFNLGGDTAELTGMVHPRYRRRKIFTRLYCLAYKECQKRKFAEILLVCDHRSSSGLAFLRSIGAARSFSEFEMKLQVSAADSGLETNAQTPAGKPAVSLQKARNSDAATIARINYSCFGVTGYIGMLPEEEEERDRITCLIMLPSGPIGKIRMEQYGKNGFVSGFGILPDYQGKGYGKQALQAALGILNRKGIKNITLEVNPDNKNALHLYESCGFRKEFVTDYHEVQNEKTRTQKSHFPALHSICYRERFPENQSF